MSKAISGNLIAIGGMYSLTVLLKEYAKFAEQLKQLIKNGFSAAVYTQTTDVEVEVNGLMTYDRKVIKVDEQKLKKINDSICRSLDK